MILVPAVDHITDSFNAVILMFFLTPCNCKLVYNVYVLSSNRFLFTSFFIVLKRDLFVCSGDP